MVRRLGPLATRLPRSVDSAGLARVWECPAWCSDGAAACSCAQVGSLHGTFRLRFPLAPSVVEIVVGAAGQRQSIGCASTALGAPSDGLVFFLILLHARPQPAEEARFNVRFNSDSPGSLYPFGPLSNCPMLDVVDLSSDVQSGDSRG